jgi:hypothetical protein
MEKKETFGQLLSPTLKNISDTINWRKRVNPDRIPEYSDVDILYAANIFADVILDRMFELQMSEMHTVSDACKQAEFVGNEIRKLIKIHTNLDTHELIKKS